MMGNLWNKVFPKADFLFDQVFPLKSFNSHTKGFRSNIGSCVGWYGRYRTYRNDLEWYEWNLPYKYETFLHFPFLFLRFLLLYSWYVHGDHPTSSYYLRFSSFLSSFSHSRLLRRLHYFREFYSSIKYWWNLLSEGFSLKNFFQWINFVLLLSKDFLLPINLYFLCYSVENIWSRDHSDHDHGGPDHPG